MPEQLKKEILLPAGEKLYSSLGSVIHGALMEHLPNDFVQAVHKQGLRPYSESIYWDKAQQKAIWRMNVLNNATATVILPILNNLDELNLRQRGYSLAMRSLEYQAQSYNELVDAMFLSDKAPKGVYMHFLTATSFKRNGQYLNFPDVFLIINSLLNRWNEFADAVPLYENQLAANLSAMCKVDRYKLHSQNFSLERQVIQGFAGSIRIRFFAGDMQRRLLGLLCSYAVYAGVGIKTALGMGGTEVEIF